MMVNQLTSDALVFFGASPPRVLQMVELLASRHPGATESNGYERVLSDALAGDRTLFAREDFAEEAWRIVDPVVKATTELHTYEPGSWGPAQTVHLAPPDGWQDSNPAS
jgi:glucose-6-phosphate 1-dehydrogenase